MDISINIPDSIRERLCIIAAGANRDLALVEMLVEYADCLTVNNQTLNDLLTLPEKSLFYCHLAHESEGFTDLKEDTNYSPERAYEIWPSRFSSLEECIELMDRGGEEALFNKVYGNRLGNNEPGDGYKYIGRGYINTTGRYNYQRLSNTIDVDVVNSPELLEEHDTAFKASISFLINDDNLYNELKNLSLPGTTKEINGGHHGLKDRQRRWQNCKTIISNFKDQTHFSLANGDKNMYVACLQFYLNCQGADLVMDGAWGRGTQRAVEEYLSGEVSFTVDDLRLFLSSIEDNF